MDFKAVFESLKEHLESLKDTVSDFFEENRKLALIISALTALILICVILLIISLNSGKSKKNNASPVDPLVISETLLVPNGPAIPRDYNISRKAKNEWSEEEVSDWFTTPTEAEIESLSKTNRNIVNEIIGAAP